ncbi:TIM barrel protein [Natronorubrum sediminis]|uniref:TIM barrel protein n=1 Tax=Natronorubrum sediminis TaxID=640943 RepID=UPI000B85EAC7|nr:sugar phosphate isomerase/epimerase family protein [Natronorubrum sediminis]
MNTAENSPLTSDAVDEYLRRYVDIAAAMSADRIIVHAGYHFTTDEEIRREVSIDRLDRFLSYAETQDVDLLLENMNPEPDDAEVHYLCSTLTDCQRYFDELDSPNLKWAFNPAHAHLADAGINAFISELDLERCCEVRLNDNRGIKEEHLMPGHGTIDFESLFSQLEEHGYDGPYTIALGSIDEMFEGIDRLVEAAPS